jgi:hypothetical protein
MSNPLEPVDAWVADALREMHREEELTQQDAARILGSEDAEASDEAISPAEAMRMLGGTPKEQIAAAAQPRRNRRRDLEHAKETLGVERPPRGVNTPFTRRMYFRFEWRYKAIAQCHRVQDQMRIVAYLEEHLTGRETDVPVEVAEAVQRLVDRSRKHSREWIPPTSSRQQYENLAQAYRQYKATQHGDRERPGDT